MNNNYYENLIVIDIALMSKAWYNFVTQIFLELMWLLTFLWNVIHFFEVGKPKIILSSEINFVLLPSAIKLINWIIGFLFVKLETSSGSMYGLMIIPELINTDLPIQSSKCQGIKGIVITNFYL